MFCRKSGSAWFAHCEVSTQVIPQPEFLISELTSVETKAMPAPMAAPTGPAIAPAAAPIAIAEVPTAPPTATASCAVA